MVVEGTEVSNLPGPMTLPLDGTEIFPGNQGGVTKRTTAAAIAAAAGLGAWTAFEPTWTTAGAGADPVVNNGILEGAYFQLGDTVFVRIYVKKGSTTTLGSGAYQFALPVAPKDGVRQALAGAVHEGGDVRYYPLGGLTAVDAALLLEFVAISADDLGDGSGAGTDAPHYGQRLNQGVPGVSATAWTTGTEFVIGGQYQAD